MTERPDALRRLRGVHEAAVLGELRRSGALSRADLTRRVGLSRTTLFAIVSDLLERGTVVERAAPERPRGRGRPALEVALNSRGAELIGIDLRRTRLHVVIANTAHDVVGARTRPLPPDSAPAARAAAAVGAVEGLAAERGLSLTSVQGIGLGLPGFVQDPASADPGALTPEAARIAAELERHFGVPLALDNNSRLAALAEVTWGAARGHAHAVYVRWSDGVGGALVINGALVRGAHGAAGEIGHTSVDPEGPRCHCGGRGCLEGAVSVPAMLAACRAAGGAVRDARELWARAAEAPGPARDAVTGAARTMGRALAALAAQTDPECLVLDGEPAALGDLVLDPVRERLAALSLPSAARPITVRASSLGQEAAARGGVALLLRAPEPGADGSPALAPTAAARA